MTTSYLADCMDCDHSAPRATAAQGKIAGLHEITVDRPRRIVTVIAEHRSPDEAAVRDALAEAGCILRGRVDTTGPWSPAAPAMSWARSRSMAPTAHVRPGGWAGVRHAARSLLRDRASRAEVAHVPLR